MLVSFSVFNLISFHGSKMCPKQVCWMCVLFSCSIRGPCGTDPQWTLSSFHLWPRVVSAGRSSSTQCVGPENLLQRIYLIWPFFSSSKCFFTQKLPRLGPRALICAWPVMQCLLKWEDAQHTVPERHQLVRADLMRLSCLFVFYLN